jgi:hypothetical protein
MDRRNVPAGVLNKLMELSDAHEYLSGKVIEVEGGIANARLRLTGSLNQQQYDDLRTSLEQMVNDLPALKRKYDTAQSTYTKCRQFIDALPDDATLETVKVKTDGHTLADVRDHIADLNAELHDIAAAPPPPSELAGAVREYVIALGTRGAPTTIVTNGCVAPEWGVRGSVNPPSPHPRDMWATVAWLDPEKLIARLMYAIEARADELQKMPRAKRAARVEALEGKIKQLRYIEEALCTANGAERSGGVPAEAVLGIRVVERKRATERAA